MRKRAAVLLATGITLISVVFSCTGIRYGENQVKIEASDHFRNGKFVNADRWQQPGVWKWLTISWGFLVVDNNRKPKTELPRVDADLSWFHSRKDNQLSVTWIAHSSLLVNLDGYRILLDPVFEERVSLVGPSRFNGRIPFNPEDLQSVDLVVISHDHYDHLNRPSIEQVAAKTRQFIVPLGVGSRLRDWGIPEDKITELDWWESHQVDNSLTLVATPAQHFSGRNLLDRDKTLWASWVMMTPNHRLFYSGDSGYFDGFKTIGSRYGPFDVTLLECGAYDENWHFVHMFPEETVQAHLDLRGTILHPVHWGTFDLALHSWYDPMQRLVAAAEKASVNAVTPVVGETTVLNHLLPKQHWWSPTQKIRN